MEESETETIEGEVEDEENEETVPVMEETEG